VLAGLALALLLAEALLRAVGFHQPLLYEPHRQLGWTLRPGAEDWYTDEGRALIQVNSAGMRDREHAVPKRADVYRIAILGDSYSEARQVPIDSTYWSLLPGRLLRCGFRPGNRVEVLNFSAAGYGTAQELLLLRLMAARYRPDLILLQFTSSNDVRNNSPELDPTENRPFFLPDADSTLRLDTSFTSRPSFRRRLSSPWRTYSRLAPWSRVLQLAGAAMLAMSGHSRESTIAVARAGLDEPALSPPTDPRWGEAWHMTETLIAEVNREAARLQAKILVMSVPWPAQILPDPRAREAFAAKVGVPDLSYADRRIKAFGRDHGIAVLTLAPRMGEAAQAGATVLNGFGRHLGEGHWNPAGHRVAAGIIAEALCAGVTVQPGTPQEADADRH
jgi:hypothetical protein